MCIALCIIERKGELVSRGKILLGEDGQKVWVSESLWLRECWMGFARILPLFRYFGGRWMVDDSGRGGLMYEDGVG